MCNSRPVVSSSRSLYLNASRRYHVPELIGDTSEGGIECTGGHFSKLNWHDAPNTLYAELYPEEFRGKGPKAAGNDPERDEADCEEAKTTMVSVSSTEGLRNEDSQGTMCNTKRNFVSDSFANSLYFCCVVYILNQHQGSQVLGIPKNA